MRFVRFVRFVSFVPFVALCLASLAALVLVCGSARVARADGFTIFRGRAAAVLALDWQGQDPAEDVADLATRLDLDLRHPIDESSRVHLGARLSWRALAGHRDGVPHVTADWPGFGLRYDAHAELREATLEWLRPWGRLTLGNDVVAWGAVEAGSPLDILNPKDFSLGFAAAGAGEPGSMALPDPMLRYERSFATGALAVVYQPFFAGHRVSPFATDTAMLSPAAGPALPSSLLVLTRSLDLRLDRQLGEALTTALEPPAATPLAGSVAARWRMRLGPVDVAIDAIEAWDRMPALVFDDDAATVLGAVGAAGFDQGALATAFLDPQVQAAMGRLEATGKEPTDLVTASWHRRTTLGLEVVAELGEGWMLRADFAFTLAKVLLDEDFVAFRSPLSQVAMTLEYAPDDALVIVLLVTGDWIHRAPPGRGVFLMAEKELGVGGGLAWSFGDGQLWRLTLGGRHGVVLGDSVATGRLGYRFDGGLDAGFGALWLAGPPTSPAGLFRDNDQVVFDVQYPF